MVRQHSRYSGEYGRLSAVGWVMATVAVILLSFLLPGRQAAVAVSETPASFNGADLHLALTDEEKAWVREHPVVRIQMSDSSPPFEFRQNGDWQGMGLDYLRVFARRIGLKIEVTELTWSEALESIKIPRDVDLLLAVTRSPEREQFMELTQGYLVFPQVIFTKKDARFVGQLSDLATSTVIVERDYVMESWLRRDLPHAKLLTVEDTASALAAVAHGTADAYVGNLAVASYLIDKRGFYNLKVAAPTDYGDEALAMGVRKDWPQLAQLLNRALVSISPEEHHAIRQKWLSVRYEYGWRMQDTIKWVLIVAAIGLVWVVQLQVLVKRRTALLQHEVELRRNRELALTQSEENIRRIIDSSPMAMHVCTLDEADRLIVRGTNPASARAFGVDNDDCRGKILEGAFPAIAATAIPQLCRLMASGEATVPSFDIEYHDQGTDAHYEVHIFRSGPGQVTVNYLDITERKRADAERRRLEAQLAQAQKMESIGRLAGGVAHDFNNMLAVILGYGDLVLRGLPDDPHLKEGITEIVEAGRRAQDLTRQLLAFSRKQVLDMKTHDFNAIVKGMEKMLRRLLGEDIEFRLHLEAEQRFVNADLSQMEQVLMNLCVNARDAMPRGGMIAIKTSNVMLEEQYAEAFSGLPPGRYLALSVSDTGYGMDDATQRQIFDPFFTTKEVGKGTGLGLATVYGIVKQHGGEVQVYSEVGRGTTFKIYLPAVNEDVAERVEDAGLEPLRARGETVLVVEDDDAVRRIACRMLARLGYGVLEAATPRQCVEIASQQTRIDLLLADVIMPEMNGRQVYDQIAAVRPDIRVLFMSGYTEDVIGAHNMLHGECLLLPKPFTEIELSRMLRKVLDA